MPLVHARPGGLPPPRTRSGRSGRGNAHRPLGPPGVLLRCVRNIQCHAATATREHGLRCWEVAHPVGRGRPFVPAFRRCRGPYNRRKPAFSPAGSSDRNSSASGRVRSGRRNRVGDRVKTLVFSVVAQQLRASRPPTRDACGTPDGVSERSSCSNTSGTRSAGSSSAPVGTAVRRSLPAATQLCRQVG